MVVGRLAESAGRLNARIAGGLLVLVGSVIGLFVCGSTVAPNESGPVIIRLLLPPLAPLARPSARADYPGNLLR